MGKNNNKKRDRWASSSEDEEEDRRKKKAVIAKKKKTTKNSNPNDTNTSSTLPLHNPLLQGCRSVYDTYEQIERIAEGTYGIVWKARNLANGETVALKQIKFDLLAGEEQGAVALSNNTNRNLHNKEGFPVAALREIKVLLALAGHESIVSVQEMVVGRKFSQCFMVMNWYEFDLKQGIQRFDGALLQGELKGILQSILSAMAFCHEAWYLHRDMKTSNILVHHTGRIALADFGLARQYSEPRRPLTQLVCTLWYRAPELLFGEARYGPAVDMWSIGCIFGELLRKAPLLEGQGELDQIDQIFSLVGVPTETSWPGFGQLPNAGLLRWKPKPNAPHELPRKFPIAAPTSANQAFLDANGYDLLERLLTLDPAKRITAKEALQHSYLCQGVPPKVPRFFSGSS